MDDCVNFKRASLNFEGSTCFHLVTGELTNAIRKWGPSGPSGPSGHSGPSGRGDCWFMLTCHPRNNLEYWVIPLKILRSFAFSWVQKMFVSSISGNYIYSDVIRWPQRPLEFNGRIVDQVWGIDAFGESGQCSAAVLCFAASAWTPVVGSGSLLRAPGSRETRLLKMAWSVLKSCGQPEVDLILTYDMWPTRPIDKKFWNIDSPALSAKVSHASDLDGSQLRVPSHSQKKLPIVAKQSPPWTNPEKFRELSCKLSCKHL